MLRAWARAPAAQNVPDMPDPGPGSVTLYSRTTCARVSPSIQDRTSGLTRLNAYAGLEAGYVVTDPIEQTLINGGTLPAADSDPMTLPPERCPAAQIPLIIEDKTFVPANIAQQDALWDTANWGAAGDLWFPHVYEPNQDPNSIARRRTRSVAGTTVPCSGRSSRCIPCKATLPSPASRRKPTWIRRWSTVLPIRR